MKLLFVLAAIFCAVAVATGEKRSYKGYQLLEIPSSSEEVVKFLRRMSQDPAMDFWRGPFDARSERPSHVHASPSQAIKIKMVLDHMHAPYQVLIPDVQKLVDEEEAHLKTRSNFLDWDNYYTFDEINEWVDSLAETHADLVTVTPIGESHEGREMKLIEIKKEGGGNKKNIYIDGGIHAREWISPATVTYLTNQLLTNTDDDTNTLLDSFNWFILPVLNPDGYSYSWTNERMWRKTRSDEIDNSGCIGTDGNRNWDHHWGEEGTSDWQCSDIYHGPHPFSEVEMHNQKTFIENNDIFVYATFHSYGQYWLIPWSYTTELPPNFDELERVGLLATKALRDVHDTKYVVGQSTILMGPTAGSSDDWALGEANATYSYTVELRDTGRYGFALPKEQIIPTGEETWAAVKAMGLDLAAKYRLGNRK